MTKAERTRAHLQTTALALFRERGYAATTVEQIARAAGVTSMTLFRHFPTKANLVLDDPYDPIIEDAVRRQDRAYAPLERARLGVAAAWAQVPEPDRNETWERIRIIEQNAELRAVMWDNAMVSQTLVAKALVDTGVPRLEAEIAAGACMGAVVAALLDWGRSDSGGLGDRVSFALDQLAPRKEPQ